MIFVHNSEICFKNFLHISKLYLNILERSDKVLIFLVHFFDVFVEQVMTFIWIF